ncbi:MAG TPA: hypothetical protein GXX18_07415 [Bacillales bacterium]|nr:hypothetical protein [Bacillales bacterium]
MDFKSLFHTITDKVKDAVHHLQGSKDKFSLVELASFIKNDSNTIKTSRQLLGIDLHEYTLTKNDIQFILESKGKLTEKILSLTVTKEGKTLIKYRSYEHKVSTDMMITLLS